MVSKKIKLLLALLVVGNSLQAGITFGKIAEFPMKLCLGAAMLYTGRQAYVYGQEAYNLEKLQKGSSPKSLNLALEIGMQSLNNSRDPVSGVQDKYILKAIGSFLMTTGIAYYFFFK